MYVSREVEKLRSYVYQAPLVKSSTKKCAVMSADEKSEVIGSVQRYFSSPLQRIVDLFIGRNNLIVKVKAMNSKNKTVIDAYTEMAMIKRPNYYISFVAGTWKGVQFKAIQTNNIVIDPEFSIKGYGIEITTKKDIFDWVRFYENDQEVAKWPQELRKNLKLILKLK